MHPRTIEESLDKLYNTVRRLRGLRSTSHARIPSGEVVEVLQREEFPSSDIKWCVRHDNRSVRVYPIDDLTPITALEALAEQAD